MNFIATSITELQTFIVQNQQIDLGLTLKCRSKVKYELIYEFLGYEFLYPDNTFFCSKTNSKEVIEHWNCDLSYLRTLGSIIGKGPLRDYETGFCSPVALTVLKKKFFRDFAFFQVFHFLFGKYSEFRNLGNKS
jgi:hypothetical protein